MRIENFKTYLDSRYTGEVIASRSILSAMKKSGLICDYSPWGYLESQKVWYVSTFSGEPCTDYEYLYYGRELQQGEMGTYENPFPSREAMNDSAYGANGFYYKGNYFTTKYLSGCFNAYLIKSEDPASGRRNQIERTMCLWGAIM